MDSAAHPVDFAALLRRWRRVRGHSQMALALAAEVSARHLSWLETGRAQPSRAMVLRLVEHLDLPLRERNALLLAAGYAPMYPERPLSSPAMAPARHVLQQVLDAHEPWPALAVDRHWHLLAANRMVGLLLQGLPAELLAPPVNVLRLTLHPQGLAPSLGGLAAWRGHVLRRLARQQAASGDPLLAALLAELQALPLPAAPAGQVEPGAGAGAGAEHTPLDEVATRLSLHTDTGVLHFITTVTVFGAPHDVALSEVAIETLLPADAGTAAALRALHAAL